MNGNISREGITTDLEAMAEIRLCGANIFNVSCDSPEWLSLVLHAANETERLKLVLNITLGKIGLVIHEENATLAVLSDRLT